VIGVLLGALGGGSILTVPVLVYLLHQEPHAAIAGSLLIVGITAAAGMIVHWRSGRVCLAPGIAFGVLGVARSCAGTRLFSSVPPGLLLSLFAGLMFTTMALVPWRHPRLLSFVIGAQGRLPPIGRRFFSLAVSFGRELLGSLLDAEQALGHHERIADLHQDQFGDDRGPAPRVAAT
jgi:uncharacterized membrane protein YfcA